MIGGKPWQDLHIIDPPPLRLRAYKQMGVWTCNQHSHHIGRPVAGLLWVWGFQMAEVAATALVAVVGCSCSKLPVQLAVFQQK